MSSAPQMSPNTAPHNKSFPDILHILLDSPRRLVFFFMFLSACAAIIGGALVALVFVMPKVLGIHPVAMRLGSEGGGILLQSSVGNKDVYQVVVNPQEGWQSTHIPVKKGQVVEFVAQGRINIDFAGVMNAIGLRQRFELMHPQLKNKGATTTPEQVYTSEERNQLRLPNPWVGPNGSNDIEDTDFPGRTQFKVMPKENFGALVGAVSERETAERLTVPSCDPRPAPQLQCAFLVGNKHRMDIDGTGYLWLNINDVVDPRDPDLFYQDNLGFFQVLITIEK